MCTRIEKRPGKFEGEPCIARLAYSWEMDGRADEYGNTEDSTPSVFQGPFTREEVLEYSDTTPVCEECLQDVLHASRILLFENNDGFVSVDVQGDDREE